MPRLSACSTASAIRPRVFGRTTLRSTTTSTRCLRRWSMAGGSSTPYDRPSTRIRTNPARRISSQIASYFSCPFRSIGAIT